MALLVLLAQQGALLHELGHLTEAAHASGLALQPAAPLLEGGVCPTCEAFSQVANPAAAHAVHPALCLPALALTPAPGYAIVLAEAPTPRSRGPPQV
jgi:hypothetical protein